MLSATSAFAVGIMWGRVLWNPASWWIGADIALISVAFFFLIRRRLYLALALALVALIFLGALNAQLEGIGALAIANDDRFALITDGREAQIAGHVIREGMLRRDAAGRLLRRFRPAGALRLTFPASPPSLRPLRSIRSGLGTIVSTAGPRAPDPACRIIYRTFGQ